MTDTTHVRPISKRKELFADVGLLYAALVWGATFVVVKDALAGVDAVTMVGYRFVLAGVLLLAWLIAKRQNPLADLGKGFFLAAVLLALYIPQTVGLKYTTAANSGFITGLFVLFVPFFLVTLFRRKPTPMEIVASVLSLLGLWVLTGGLRQVNYGDALTLIAAMAYALHLLLSDKYMKAGVDPLRTSCQQFLIVGTASLLISGATGRSFVVSDGPTWLAIVFLALFPTLSAFVIQMFAQRFTSPLRVSLIFALEPVFAAIFAWTVGGELFTSQGAFGGLLIVIALMLSGIQLPAGLIRRKPA